MNIVTRYILAILLLLHSHAGAASIVGRFHPIPTDDIITSVYSFCVFQDSRGIIWACTQNGLASYDGNKVKAYRHLPNKSDSLSSNIVRDIVEDRNGNLWIATINGGLEKFDPRTETFTHFTHDPNDPSSLGSNQIWSLHLDANGTLWIGTFKNGLNSLLISNESITRYPELKNENEQSLGRIASLTTSIVDNKNLLLGTDDGLYVFNKRDYTLAKFENQKLQEKTKTATIWDIKQVPGVLWIASSAGLSKLEYGETKNFTHFDTVTSGLPINDIRSVMVNADGSLWLAAMGGGLVYISPESKISSLTNSVSDTDSLPHNSIWEVSQSRDGMLWVATAGGIASFNPRSTAFSVFDRNWLDASLRNEFYVRAMLKDIQGNLWLSSNYGLVRVDSTGQKHMIPSSFKTQDPDLLVHDMMEDSSGSIWLASAASGLLKIARSNDGKSRLVRVVMDCCQHASALAQLDADTILVGTIGYGLVKFNTKTAHFDAITSPSIRLNITKIINLRNGKALLGTYSGVYIIDLETGDTKNLAETNPQLKDIFVLDIVPDNSDGFYIGSDNGLFHLVKPSDNAVFESKHIQLLSSEQPPPVIFSITGNGEGKFWLGTGTYLIIYQPGMTPIQVHGYNGLPMTAFARGTTSYDQSTKTVFFGGQTGVLSFQEGAIKTGTHPPEVLITSVTARGDDTDSTITKLFGTNIALTYRQKNLLVNFAAPDYIAPALTEYAYRLSGYSETWIETGRIGQTTLTNLDPGQYILQVKAKIANGVWSEHPATLQITVIPPWWRTRLAYSGYIIACLLLLGLFVRFQNRRVRHAQAISQKLRDAEKLREHFVEQLEDRVQKATSDLNDSMEALQIKNVELEVANKRAQDVSQLKSRFLADMSHELRTPMNGILGFTELLGKTPLDGTQKDYVSTIRQSGQLLLDMVGNVLDISKIEAGKISLDERLFSLRTCLDETLTLLTPIAYDKGHELVCIIDPELPDILLGDPARLRQIVTNLTGNAIKFTQHGSVCIRVMLDKLAGDTVSLTLAVSDTGIGISSNEQSRLFQTFSQAHPGIGQRFGGSGLGLSICKGLVEAMGGTIHVQSTAGVGSVFTVTLDLLLPGAESAKIHHGELDNIAWQPDSRFAKATVLLYDHHPLSVQAIGNLLQSWGVRVVEVTDDHALADELRRNLKRPRYNACICALTQADLQSTDELGTILKEARGKTPLLVLASTLSMDILCALEVQWQATCLPKTTSARLMHNALSTILEEQPQFARTSRDIQAMQQDRALAGMRILITDDNLPNRELLRRILRHNGAHTSEAADGAETLQRLRDEAWDVLLLDIHMPGMSGIDVARELRAGKSPNRQIPIIAVTANALPEMRDWALSHGMDAYLIKPYTEEALLAALATVSASAASS